ncbi:MAG: hypothetical protein ABR529_07115 [Actinomycetota bacterium]
MESSERSEERAEAREVREEAQEDREVDVHQRQQYAGSEEGRAVAREGREVAVEARAAAAEERLVSQSVGYVSRDDLRESQKAPSGGLRNVLLGGLVAAAMTVALAFGAYALLPTDDLKAQHDRNAQVTVAAASGLRCYINLNVGRKQETIKPPDIEKCYAEYDRLIRLYHLEKFDAHP